ncbi:Crp/Fnr family transcriptional regulator [Candidatus Sumerlaeota bacterium]|nr:Crp/Fnr family transcriptional regulator [Candidatus Sumerlaeota bacterium]
MGTPEFTEAIAFCPLFQACRADDRGRIAAIAQARTHRRGDVIFGQGEPADAFYLVTEGVVRVLRTTTEGQEATLHLVRPGEIFGLAPFFLDHPYPAMAVCSTTRGATLRFPRTPFLKLLGESPDLAPRLLGGLAVKLHEFTIRFESLTGQTLPVRLARWLILDLAGEAKHGTTHELPMSKRNLAALLGATPETLSRALRRLAEEGVIRIGGKRITLLDPERLNEIAELD